MKQINSTATVDEYISNLPAEVQEKMNRIRKTIKENAPDAVEKMSYGMPAYTQNGMLLYFAAHKNHIGFYPLVSAIKVFKDELAEYHCSKGTVQFPHSKPLPLDLIKEIVIFRVNENAIIADSKRKVKKQ
jgi:uncharacterized protein YdhG (YjbR/CyaY superfamily)